MQLLELGLSSVCVLGQSLLRSPGSAGSGLTCVYIPPVALLPVLVENYSVLPGLFVSNSRRIKNLAPESEQVKWSFRNQGTWLPMLPLFHTCIFPKDNG